MNAQEFIYRLFKDIPDGWIEIAHLAPKGVTLYPKTVVQWRQLPLTNVPDNIDMLHRYNQRGYGCHIGIAARDKRKYPETRINRRTGEPYTMQYPRGTQQDVSYIPALWADADAQDHGGDMRKAYRAIKALNPSIIVDSGGGYHGYLLLDTPLRVDDANRGAVRRLLRGIAAMQGTDKNVAEISRMMRVPDTVNTKTDRNGVVAKIIEYHEHTISFDTAMGLYALPERARIEYAPVETDDDLILSVERALSHIPADAIAYDDWLAILAGLTHALGANAALPLALNWTAWCSQEGEVEDKIESFDNGGTATLGKVFFIAKQYGYSRYNGVNSTSYQQHTSTNKILSEL